MSEHDWYIGSINHLFTDGLCIYQDQPTLQLLLNTCSNFKGKMAMARQSCHLQMIVSALSDFYVFLFFFLQESLSVS